MNAKEREIAETVGRTVQAHLDRAYPDAERPHISGEIRHEDGWWIVPVVYSREGDDLFLYFGRLATISIAVREEIGHWVEVAPIPMPIAA